MHSVAPKSRSGSTSSRLGTIYRIDPFYFFPRTTKTKGRTYCTRRNPMSDLINSVIASDNDGTGFMLSDTAYCYVNALRVYWFGIHRVSLLLRRMHHGSYLGFPLVRRQPGCVAWHEHCERAERLANDLVRRRLSTMYLTIVRRVVELPPSHQTAPDMLRQQPRTPLSTPPLHPDSFVSPPRWPHRDPQSIRSADIRQTHNIPHSVLFGHI